MSSSAEILTTEADLTNRPLMERVRAGVGWNAGSIFFTHVIGFIRSIIIARLLLPEDFGLFGMALTIVAALNAFTTISLDQSLIAGKFAREDLGSHLNTVWSAELIRSAILAVLIAASAYPTASFYGEPRLYLLVPLLGLTTLAQGFRNVGLVLLRKEISFGRIFWYELASGIAGTVLIITLVLLFRNVSALVVGHVLGAIAGVILSYVFHPYRPRLAFHPEAFRAAFTFGKFALIIAVTSYLSTMADKVAVGRLLGPEVLGNYVVAYTLATIAVTALVYTVTSVMFPAYAELTARNPERLQQAFLKVFGVGSLLLITITAPLFLLSSEIVDLLYGSQWALAGAVLQIVVLGVPLRGTVLLVSSLFLGMNRPKPLAISKVLEALLLLIILVPLIKVYGLTGAAWSGVIVFGFALLSRLVVLEKLLPGARQGLIKILLFSSAAWGSGIVFGWYCINAFEGKLGLIIGGVVTTVSPAVVLLVISSELRRSVVQQVRQR